MVVAVTDSMHYHLDTARGKTSLRAFLSSLTAARVDITQHEATATLITEGPNGFGAIAMDTADNSFTDTRKVVISLISPLALLYATTLTKVWIHLMPDPINPRFLCIYRVPKPETEDGEILPPKPAPHTQAALNRTDMAAELVADITWTSSGLPSQEKQDQRDIATSRNVTRLYSPPSP
jgi:hypothetical protein